MVVLGLDPGKVNFGYSIILLRDRAIKLLDKGVLKNTITDLKDNLYNRTCVFDTEIIDLVAVHGVTHIIGERFVSRGLLGSLSEYVNIMLGICSCRAKTDFQLLVPATWKNRFNKVYDLDKLYSELRVTKHEIDATLIALYYIDQSLKRVPYAWLKNGDNYNRFKSMVTK